MATPGSNDDLFAAADRGDEAAVRSHLQHCRNLEDVSFGSYHDYGLTALQLACRKGHLRIAGILLDHGASVHTHHAFTYDTALLLAVKNGWTGTAALLLSRGADVRADDNYRCTALHLAAYGGCEQMIKLLLRYRPDVEAVNTSGEPPLVHACIRGNSKVANELIRSGANVRWVATDPYCTGYTLVHLAAGENLADTVQLLLDSKAAPVDAVTQDGRTALHMACYKGHLNAARCLLENGARVNYPCRGSGSTALHLAAQETSLELVQLLHKYGAGVKAKNHDGQTPLAFALADPTSSPGVIQFLRSHT